MNTAEIIDSDEVFARFLQEQEELELESMQNADLELAIQLQNESHSRPQEVHSTSASSSSAASSSSSRNKSIFSDTQFNRDLQLAQELARAEEQSDLAFAQKLQQKEIIALDDEEDDYTLAKKLENTVDESILDEELPNLHQLFIYFNRTYFNQQLDMVEVKWSNKMTRCAGTCAFKNGNHCIVTLSEPLLKFRQKKDYFETLLHEMIHALLFITSRNTDRDGHGPEFLREAKRISDAANLNITVYHNFHDEVHHYLTHVWKCDGPCKDRPPYYGTVKRAMNRPPQKADTWFDEHQRTCGGTFTKIASPPPKEKPEASKKRKKQNNTLDNYFADVDVKMKKLKEF